MQIVYLDSEGIVQEIPTNDPNGNIQTMGDIVRYYSEEFASHCVTAPDEVEQQWVYDPQSGVFSPPSETEPQAPADPAPDPLTDLQIALVEQFEENLALREEITNAQLALAEMYEMMLGGVVHG